MANGVSLTTGRAAGFAAHCWRRGREVLLGQRLLPILVTAAAGWIIFTVFRGGLLLARLGAVAALPAGQIAGCFLTGLRYDAIPIGYALLPLALTLFLAPNSAFRRAGFRRGVVVYGAALAALAALVEVIGAAFFLHFGRRLDWMAFNYPKHIREIGIFIWNRYPILLILPAIGAIFYGSFRLYRRVFWRGPVPRGQTWPRLLAGAVVTGLCILACRGGLGSRPLRFGPAFFTSNNFINQLTMNNFFTFFYAVKSNMRNGLSDTKLYPFPPADQARTGVAQMLFQGQDDPAGSLRNPFWRRTDTGRPQQNYNVVLLIMEGMSGQPVGALGYSPSHTPQLDSLCREGMFFERMYAAGARTSRAMIAVLCGHPDLDGVSVLEQQQAQGKFFTLPSVFRGRGYRTMFIYGGDPEFDNMKMFFSKGGVEEIMGQAQMQAKELEGNWGVPDEVTLRRAHEKFLSMADQPFFAVVLTLTNHQPYEVPPGRIKMLPGADEDSKRLNAYRYSDWALGEYFRMARQAEYFRRTIFVLVADHGHNIQASRMIDVPGYRVPCLFYAPGIIPPSRHSVIASQTDIAPTLLALLGGSYEHCFLGRNLQAVEEGDGFALMHAGGSVAFLRADRAVVLPPDRPKATLFRTGPFTMEDLVETAENEPQRRQLQSQMLSYYMMSGHLYLTSAYCRPADVKTEGPGGEAPPEGEKTTP